MERNSGDLRALPASQSPLRCPCPALHVARTAWRKAAIMPRRLVAVFFAAAGVWVLTLEATPIGRSILGEPTCLDTASLPQTGR